MSSNIGYINMAKEFNGYRYSKHNEEIDRVRRTDQRCQAENIRSYLGYSAKCFQEMREPKKIEKKPDEKTEKEP